MRSFVKTKSSQNGEITLSFTDIGKSCIFRVTNMSFNAYRENKILTKIFGFTVIKYDQTVQDLMCLVLV